MQVAQCEIGTTRIKFIRNGFDPGLLKVPVRCETSKEPGANPPAWSETQKNPTGSLYSTLYGRSFSNFIIGAVRPTRTTRKPAATHDVVAIGIRLAAITRWLSLRSCAKRAVSAISKIGTIAKPTRGSMCHGSVQRRSAKVSLVTQCQSHPAPVRLIGLRRCRSTRTRTWWRRELQLLS
jgi:hypothetical protein